MPQAELLQQNNTFPAIDRTELLKDSQNREFNRLLGTLESDRFGLLDLENLLINIGKTNPKAIPYIQEYKANFNAGLEQLLVKSGVGKTETQSKPKERAKVLTEKPNITLTQEKQDSLVKSGETEIKAKEQELKQVEQKLVQIDLIRDVANIYKEYLQSIKDAIQFKMLSGKNERFEKQIGIIGEKVTLLTNLETFLGRLKNFDEIKKLDLNDLVNKLFVSEKEISKDGIMEQPFMNGILYHEATTSGVNEGYAKIRKLLLTPNITQSKAQEIKLQVFSKIRQIDKLGADDNNLILDTSEPISSRITGNVLNNKDLRTKPDINTTFDLLQSFTDGKKQELFNTLKGGNENLKTFLTHSKVLEKLGFKTEKKKNEFISDLYENLKESLKAIDNTKAKKALESEINKQFDYLEARVPEREKTKIRKEKIDALKPEKVQEQVEKLKQEAVFTLFEKTVTNRVLENNSKFVEALSKKDTAVSLYADIEGIGSKVSDKNLNKFSNFSQTLVEGIALMYVSGIVGGLLVRGASYGELMASLPTTGLNLRNTAMLGASLSVEGAGFYGTYTALNGLMKRENGGEIIGDFNNYDLARTITFLGVLRSIPLDKLKESFNVKNNILNETKNITLDTGALLGTDIVVRGSLGEIMGKEGIPRDVDGNLTGESIAKFTGEELQFIIPLVIGLRQADRSIATLFEGGKKPKITVIPTEKEFIIQIEGLKKEIRTLRQQRNIARNKGKSHKEVTEELKTKKKEYKRVRDENNEVIAKSGTGNTDTPTAVLQSPNQTQNVKDKGKQPKDTNTQRDNVNMNTGAKTIQETLSGNIEDVMKGFEGTKQGLSLKFQDLLKSGGDRIKAQELINNEVDKQVAILTDKGVVVDEIEGNRFIREFKEQRIAEFDKLVEMIGDGKNISGDIDMRVNVNGKEFVWKLELKDVKMMREFFGEYVKIQENYKVQLQRKPELKNNN